MEPRNEPAAFPTTDESSPGNAGPAFAVRRSLLHGFVAVGAIGAGGLLVVAMVGGLAAFPLVAVAAGAAAVVGVAHPPAGRRAGGEARGGPPRGPRGLRSSPPRRAQGPAHRPRQPPRLPGGARPPGRRRDPRRPPGVARRPRPRRPQAAQRERRPRGRRPAAGRRRAPDPRLAPRRRPPVPHRRRRVRAAPAGDGQRDGLRGGQAPPGERDRRPPDPARHPAVLLLGRDLHLPEPVRRRDPPVASRRRGALLGQAPRADRHPGVRSRRATEPSTTSAPWRSSGPRWRP